MEKAARLRTDSLKQQNRNKNQNDRAGVAKKVSQLREKKGKEVLIAEIGTRREGGEGGREKRSLERGGKKKLSIGEKEKGL